HGPGRMHDRAGITSPPARPGVDGTGRFDRARASMRGIRLRALIGRTGRETVVEVVLEDGSTGTTTLVRAAKFCSPGVPTLSARTVRASDVPGAAFAGGWRTTVRFADPLGGMFA